jgi:hypothetical protein
MFECFTPWHRVVWQLATEVSEQLVSVFRQKAETVLLRFLSYAYQVLGFDHLLVLKEKSTDLW